MTKALTSCQSLCVGVDLFSRSVSRQVSSALVSLTSVFGMGTGGPSPLKTPTAFGQTKYYTIQFPMSSGRSREDVTILPDGTPSGTRTLDTLIKSQVLYQLS